MHVSIKSGKSWKDDARVLWRTGALPELVQSDGKQDQACDCVDPRWEKQWRRSTETVRNSVSGSLTETVRNRERERDF